jgi:hypothetical protein
MNKREQQLTTKIQHYIRHNIRMTFCWEVKIIDVRNGTKVLNYKQHIAEHQILSLKMCESHFVYKISDLDRTTKPFDGVSIAESPGYFFIQFYKPREKKVYMIEAFQIEREINNGSKSLSEQRADEICYQVIELK